jgi:hypothetical protein
MKMMKTACLVAAVAILVLGLTACGSSTTDDSVTFHRTIDGIDVATHDTVDHDDHRRSRCGRCSVQRPILENGIRAALNKPTGDITLAEAATLKELELSIEFESPEEMRIKDLSGLEHFVNLETLGLQFHWLSDISPLSGLTHLKSLGLGGNSISDITPLAGMTELDFLSIFNCQATDYSPLENSRLSGSSSSVSKISV